MSTEQRSRKQKALSHGQFYSACECLKKNKQQFLDDRPNLVTAAEMLTKLVGFPISKSSVTDLQEATGVSWESRRVGGPTQANSIRANHVRTLTVALYRLYKKLGEEAPESLFELFNYITNKASNGTPTEEPKT